MSRSRKKHPVVKDFSRGNNGTRWDKRNASKKVRYHKGPIPDGGHYKKLYCSWNIHDYSFYYQVSDKYVKHPEFTDEDYRNVTYQDVEKAKRK